MGASEGLRGPRLLVGGGAALFLIHFFLPWKLQAPEQRFDEVDGEWRSFTVVHEPESCLQALGSHPVSHFSVFIPAFLMLVFVAGALRPKLAGDLSGIAGVLAGISAFGTFCVAAFLAVLLPVGLFTSDSISKDLAPILLTIILTAFLGISSWLAWTSAKIRPTSAWDGELKFFLCHAAIVLAGFPHLDLLVYYDPGYGSQGYAFTLLCGLLGWAGMLAGALGLCAHARRGKRGTRKAEAAIERS